jgi:hypothetical protein
VELIVEPGWRGLVATAAALAPGFLLILWFRRQRREKANAVFPGLLRGPGQSLRARLGRIDNRINDYLVFLIVASVVVVLWTLAPVLALGDRPGLGNYLQLGIALVLLLPFPAMMAFRRLRERAQCRLALDAGLAVGRELNLIMPQGFHVFHDFEDEGHRVDHVVVGPAGVHAVTSKGRPRPEKGGVGLDASVLYTGEALYFPDNTKETEAIARARQQAEYLAGWLSSEVGERILVEPTLALPGWFVERKKADDLILLSGQNQHYARILKGPEVLEEDLLKRIVKLLDSKCREVESPGPRRGARRRRK